MTRLLFVLAFALGAGAVGWIGLGALESGPLALSVTTLIGAVYGLGFLELLRFRRDSAALSSQLTTLPDSRNDLTAWLDRLAPGLQPAVRRRIDGEPAALPGPMLTPYLLGLLVMLGLLGTFLGMIVTLDGAATALNGSSELTAIRSALAAPIAGLSLAFGTSIAGVSASAMLGLATTLCRQDRVLLSRQLDRILRGDRHQLSAQYQREQAYTALQQQSQAMPDVIAALQSMTQRLEHMSEQLSDTLTRNQQSFHDTLGHQYQELAHAVTRSLQDTLSDSSRLAAEGVQPIVAQAMNALSVQVEQSQRQLNDLAEQQLGTLSERFQQTTSQAAEHWRTGLDAHQQASAALAKDIGETLNAHQHQLQRRSEALLESIATAQGQFQEHTGQHLERLSERFHATTDQAAAAWQEGLNGQQAASRQLAETLTTALAGHHRHFEHTAAELIDGQRSGLDTLILQLREELGQLRQQEADRGKAASDRLAELEGTVARHLGTLGAALEAPMARLIETASETPKAAAEVIRQLRQEMTRSSERDNELLVERQRIMTELDALLSKQRDAASAHNQAIQTLIDTASQSLTEVSQTFSRQVNEQGQRLNEVASDIRGSAHEVGSLSDAFGVAVQHFSESSGKLLDALSQIETSLETSATRNDEQLAYYVEQAREVIELSMSSQREVIDALATLRRGRAAQPTAEVS
ncbi:DUF802 domain-containing protein [Marinobacter sp. SS21]|uniref:DUF802 domain-containing protein n=1 Tax=Marinobacter sp. SS21 TaxID=2979460 RepID=UPI00232C5061|nr:DUF802 domain-containing protein [Marinobacter sp. SS21]MDC0664339.1 DUF802 domain-containing protein [Marinobacter sp. SS21]